jgi:hypothetical protein
VAAISTYLITKIEAKYFCSSPPQNFTWTGTWYSSFAGISKNQITRITCDNVFSDVLYRPFLCAHTPLTPYVRNIPLRNQIARLESLSQQDFSAKWVNTPFILQNLVTKWPVYKNWSEADLLKEYGEVSFRAEAVDWSLNTYVNYMNDNDDESPLYLFDRSFVEKMNIKVGPEGAYWPPSCFGEDLFALLHDDRPDSRWLIVGPERSGSTFHKDPNATSAWNAVLRGSKYWIMFPTTPGSAPPPGVYVSEDQSEVTSPLSIAEWLIGFHAEARATPGCVEGICEEGEILHVPSGWWHLVVNLAPSIAITQNFVPEEHLASALGFLRDKKEQISGFKKGVEDPFGLFCEKMEEYDEELLKKALAKLDRSGSGRKRKWETLVRGDGKENSDEPAGFSFGVGGGDESEEEVP